MQEPSDIIRRWWFCFHDDRDRVWYAYEDQAEQVEVECIGTFEGAKKFGQTLADEWEERTGKECVTLECESRGKI